MSEQPIRPLPELRPVRLQGGAYYKELRRLLRLLGGAIVEDAKAFHRRDQKITVDHVAQLALKYHLNMKAVAEYLEDRRVLPTGSYERLLERGLRPMTALTQVWNRISDEQIETWERQRTRLEHQP